MAEAAAQSGDVSGARKELLNTAKRNPAIRTEDDLPGTKEALLAFIAEERQRELFEEGHRWYDARRTGEKIEVADGKYKKKEEMLEAEQGTAIGLCAWRLEFTHPKTGKKMKFEVQPEGACFQEFSEAIKP